MRPVREASRAPGRPLRTAALTLLALVAFAGNSLLCRLALGEGTIDAASFASLRLCSGALVLVALVAGQQGGARWRGAGSWGSALALFLYAVPFSFAYLSLTTGVGALVLFAAVQATMILAGIRSGERPRALEWLGVVLALGGLGVLARPGEMASPAPGLASMALAGVAWGVYSLRGRGGEAPVVATSGNFLRAAPLALLVSLALSPHAHLTVEGALLAVVSGALASGLGYVVWYAALRGLTATRAAVVQLAVPVLAAAGGVWLLNEAVTLRLLVASLLILGGVGVALAARWRLAPTAPAAVVAQP